MIMLWFVVLAVWLAWLLLFSAFECRLRFRAGDLDVKNKFEKYEVTILG